MTPADPSMALNPTPRTVSLPRMGRALDLAVATVAGVKVWWADPNLLVLWSPVRLPVGTETAGRIDLLGGGTANITFVVPEGQPPLKSEEGHVVLARYHAADAAAARALSTSLIRINPRAFKPDYVPPRLPKAIAPPTARSASRPGLGGREQALLAVAGMALLGLVTFLMV